MGSSSSKMKVRPVHKPIADGPNSTRIFTPFGPHRREPGQPMQIELDLTQDIAKVTALFVIRYSPDYTGETREIMINGHLVRLPLSAANALQTVFDHSQVVRGLTGGWQPWFWMDCISINGADLAETQRQRRLEQYIYAVAKWTLDCTGPVAQIKLGTNAYQGAVIDYGGPIGNAIAVEESIDNLNRIRNHIPGRVIWTAR